MKRVSGTRFIFSWSAKKMHSVKYRRFRKLGPKTVARGQKTKRVLTRFVFWDPHHLTSEVFNIFDRSEALRDQYR